MTVHLLRPSNQKVCGGGTSVVCGALLEAVMVVVVTKHEAESGAEQIAIPQARSVAAETKC